MHVIKDNPYRVLGVLSNSGAKAIAANQGKIKAFLKTNRPIVFPNDFVKLLGAVARTEVSVNNAFSAISLPKDKLVAGFFWFMSENSIDEIALNNLRNGDLDKAIEVQRKKKTVASCINLAVMYLLKEEWQKAIYYYAYLLSSKERRDELLSIIADNSNLMTESEVVELFCDEIIRSFPKVDWYEVSRTQSIEFDGKEVAIEDFLKDSNIGRYFSKEAEEKVIKDLDSFLNKSTKASDPEDSLKIANTLKVKSHPLLLKMKLLFGKGNLRYKSYADKVANRILNLCIDYYNSDIEDPDKPRKVLLLTKYALRTAEGVEAKNRAQRNLDVIQAACDALPPAEVKSEFEEIDYLINSYNNQKNRLLLLSCVQGCGIALKKIKEKIGTSNSHYINKSSDVVHFVISVIVDEVNKAQKIYNDAPEYYDAVELTAYQNCLKWAKPIMDSLFLFAKDERCLNRYRENHDTLNSLYSKYCPDRPYNQRTSATPSGASQPTRPRSVYTPPSNSSNSNDNSGCMVFGVIASVVLGIFFIIVLSTSNTSSTPPSLSDYDTVVVDSVATEDYSYSENNNNSYEYETEKSQTDIWLEDYRGNSLNTGSTPYRSLYGGNSKVGHSGLKVIAPTDCDVIVILKNKSGAVVKHAYIRAGGFYSFTIRGGTYQTFFIFGNSWCPEKEAPNGQMGYFLENISISKDDPQYIDDYQELTYTLQSMVGGNFSAQSSNSYEAF